MKLLFTFLLVIVMGMYLNGCKGCQNNRKAFYVTASEYPSKQVITKTIKLTTETGVDISGLLKTDIEGAFQDVMKDGKYTYGKADKAETFQIDGVHVTTGSACKTFEKTSSSCDLSISVQRSANDIAPLFAVKYLTTENCRDASSAYVSKIITLATEVLPKVNITKLQDKHNTVENIKTLCQDDEKNPSFLCNLVNKVKVTDDDLSIYAYKTAALSSSVINIKFKKPIIHACIKSLVAPSLYGKTGVNREGVNVLATFKVSLITGIWPAN